MSGLNAMVKLLGGDDSDQHVTHHKDVSVEQTSQVLKDFFTECHCGKCGSSEIVYIDRRPGQQQIYSQQNNRPY